uniref:Uncharacterized protein n=1 Tax=Alexandrium monilatum TaxID=311494 RepID=A0A7S4V368_9DINO
MAAPGGKPGGATPSLSSLQAALRRGGSAPKAAASEEQATTQAPSKRSLAAEDAAAALPSKKRTAVPSQAGQVGQPVAAKAHIVKTPAVKASGLCAKVGFPGVPAADTAVLGGEESPGAVAKVQSPAKRPPATATGASQLPAKDGGAGVSADAHATDRGVLAIAELMGALEASAGGAKLRHVVKLAEAVGKTLPIDHINHFLRVLKKKILERAQADGVRVQAVKAPAAGKATAPAAAAPPPAAATATAAATAAAAAAAAAAAPPVAALPVMQPAPDLAPPAAMPGTMPAGMTVTPPPPPLPVQPPLQPPLQPPPQPPQAQPGAVPKQPRPMAVKQPGAVTKQQPGTAIKQQPTGGKQPGAVSKHPGSVAKQPGTIAKRPQAVPTPPAPPPPQPEPQQAPPAVMPADGAAPALSPVSPGGSDLPDDPLYALVAEVTEDPVVRDGELIDNRLSEVLKRLWDGVARKTKDWVAAWQAMGIPLDKQSEALQRFLNMAFCQTEDPDRAPLVVAELIKSHKVKLRSMEEVLVAFGHNLDGIMAVNEDAWQIYAKFLLNVFPKPARSGWGWSRVGWSWTYWWQFVEKSTHSLEPARAFDVLALMLRLIQDKEGQPLGQVQVWTDDGRLQRVLNKIAELGQCELSEAVETLTLQGVVLDL